jgi:hypothetical protein
VTPAAAEVNSGRAPLTRHCAFIPARRRHGDFGDNSGGRGMAHILIRPVFALLRGVRRIVGRIGLWPYVVLVTVVPIGAFIIGLLTLFETKSRGVLNVDSVASKAKLAALMAFAVIGVVGGICLPYVERHYRQRGEDFKAVAKGEYWARWQITAQEWRAFLDAERKEVHSDAGLTVIVFLVFGFGMGGILIAKDQLAAGLAALGFWAFMAALQWWYLNSRRNSAHPRRVPEVIIARDFAVTNGKHTRFNFVDEMGNGFALASAKLHESDPPMIELTAYPVRGRVIAALEGSRTGVVGAAVGAIAPNAAAGAPLILYLPAPTEKKDEAKALIARFEREVIATGF